MSGGDVDELMVHGGRLDEAARCFPEAPLPWLDLSTGINPLAWDGSFPPVDLRHLPGTDTLRALETAAANAFGARDVSIAALPGSEIGLRLLAHTALPAPFHIVTPGYRTHTEAFAAAQAIGVDQLDEAAARGGTILLANPNNPDGRTVAPERLIALARTLAARGGWLVIDEAFADATPECSVLPWLRADDHVMVLRSFGKFFGLAGVRLGFACGNPSLVQALTARLGSWPVSATAIVIGTAAYRDASWIIGMRMTLQNGAAAMDELLMRHGLAPMGSSPLFRLVEADDAAALFERLARAGILTRPFDYAPRRLRFGLADGPATLDRLDRALSDR